MTESTQSLKQFLHLKRIGFTLAAAWTAAIFLVFGWHLWELRENTLESARIQASDAFEKDLVYRRWAAGHGGVYVPVTEATPPNPHLSHVKNRDVTTTSGVDLTLVNPAYMTRQVHELEHKQCGHQGHITSLNPLRPENAPDAWEAEALGAFERSPTEVVELAKITDTEYMRLMRPMITEARCLKCHADQGYKVGDLRGGISVSVPMAPLRAVMYGHMATVTTGYLLLWLLGLAGIGLSTRRIGRHIAERDRTQETLLESEERIRAVLDASPDVIHLLDANGIILSSNEGFAERVGLEIDDVVGKCVFDFAPEESIPGRKAAIAKVFRTGEPLQLEDKGRTGVFESHVHPVLDPAGEVTAVAVYARDITERKRAGEEQRKLAAVIEHTRELVNMSTLEGKMLFLNEAGGKMLGIEPGEVEQVNIMHVIPEHLRGLVQSELLPALMEGGAWEGDLQYRNRQTGKLVDVHAMTFSINDPGTGKPLFFANVSLDITERKRAENALRESEEKHRLLFESSREAIMTLAPPSWRFTSGNPAALEVFGAQDEADFVSRAPWEYSPPSQPDGRPSQEKAKEMIETAMQEGSHLFEWRHKRLDGEEFPAMVLLTRFELAGQALLQATVRDVSAQEQLEERLRQAQKLESIGTLAGGVAYDFNNLLMGVMGYVELCRNKIEPDHPIREWLDEITSDAQRSAGIVRQLLAFARKQTIAPKVLDINDAVAGMLMMLRRLIGEDIDLAWQPAANVWSVKMDPSQIDQILANLCVNARDAIGGVGKLTIETENAAVDADYCATHAEAVPGEYVMLAVSDNGCGMDQDTLEHVFEPFFTTKGVGEGTGLGLATVYGIAKQNDGLVEIYSEPGEGTTFKIYLPRFAGGAAQTSDRETPAPCPRGSETILLVEDEKSVRVTTRIFLQDLGYTVLAAESPQEALRLAGEHAGKIHLLLTDVIMPGLNGPDLAEKLADRHPGMKRLLMSGYTANVIAHHGILDKSIQFLSKPFTRDVLAKKVREILDNL